MELNLIYKDDLAYTLTQQMNVCNTAAQCWNMLKQQDHPWRKKNNLKDNQTRVINKENTHGVKPSLGGGI